MLKNVTTQLRRGEKKNKKKKRKEGKREARLQYRE
jgi:hypothetical protein